MNTGAFGEGFPYSNFHNLNMDWIIKIAKDFLDQYTHIQQIIEEGEESLQNLTTEGLESLQEKADNLTELLQDWYDTHSEDIADQLADALADLNDWYTTHQNYLNATLTEKTAQFNTSADAKAQETIASIPDDYTTLTREAMKSLEILGYAGQVLSSANNAQPNSIYIVAESDMQYYPTDMPATYSGYLITICGKAHGYDQYIWRQYAFDQRMNPLYYRSKVGTSGIDSGSFGAWTELVDQKLYNVWECLGYANIVLSDADLAEKNTIYRIVGSTDLQYYPENLPWIEKRGWLVTTENKAKGYAQYFWKQYVFDNFGNLLYTRDKSPLSSDQWDEWKQIQNPSSVISQLPYNLIWIDKKTIGHYIDSNNGAIGNVSTHGYTIIPVNANEEYILTNKSCHIAFFSSKENIGTSTADFISGLNPPANSTFIIPANAHYMTVSLNYKNPDNIAVMLKSDYTKPIIRKDYINSLFNIIRVEKDGTGDFTKLTDALVYALQRPNTTIYLGKGTYNIIEELGSTYFENFTYEAYTNMGPKIGNGTHLICSSKSKITCMYTGSNTEVMEGFSIFNCVSENVPGMGDYTIEGANIFASNIRYCVHDDCGIMTTPYIHKYKNCEMNIDNSNRSYPPNHKIHRCIGGGMGTNGTIIVESCIFDGQGDYDNIVLAWHNDNYIEPAEGKIIIKDCYCKNDNTIELHSIGAQTETTPCLVSGNSVGSAIYVHHDSAENFDVKLWNNQIR